MHVRGFGLGSPDPWYSLWQDRARWTKVWMHQPFVGPFAPAVSGGAGGKCCAMLRPFYQKIDLQKSCREIYKKGAELAVEVALSAPRLVPECRMPKSLHRVVERDS